MHVKHFKKYIRFNQKVSKQSEDEDKSNTSMIGIPFLAFHLAVELTNSIPTRIFPAS